MKKLIILSIIVAMFSMSCQKDESLTIAETREEHFKKLLEDKVDLKVVQRAETKKENNFNFSGGKLKVKTYEEAYDKINELIDAINSSAEVRVKATEVKYPEESIDNNVSSMVSNSFFNNPTIEKETKHWNVAFSLYASASQLFSTVSCTTGINWTSVYSRDVYDHSPGSLDDIWNEQQGLLIRPPISNWGFTGVGHLTSIPISSFVGNTCIEHLKGLVDLGGVDVSFVIIVKVVTHAPLTHNPWREPVGVATMTAQNL